MKMTDLVVGFASAYLELRCKYECESYYIILTYDWSSVTHLIEYFYLN